MKNLSAVFKEKKNAQTMVELAVFGAVLFFLIGGIMSNYLSGSFQQNAQLQTMRIALWKSYLSSQNKSSARLSGSFMMIEDRLTGEFGKYGTIDRQPIMMSGSGMMSSQVMQPPDPWGVLNNTPLMDITVNGEPFVFRTGAQARYVILLKWSAVKGATVADTLPGVQIIELKKGWDYTETTIGGYECLEGESCDPADVPPCPAPAHSPCAPVEITTTYTEQDQINSAISACLGGAASSGLAVNCNMGASLKDDMQRRRLTYEWLQSIDAGEGPFPRFYLSMTRTDASFLADVNNETKRRLQFNLPRDGILTHVFPKTQAANAAWRWSWKNFATVKDEIKPDEDAYPNYDIDGDLREEMLYGLYDVTAGYCGGGACRYAYSVLVQDSKVADLDPQRVPKDYDDVIKKPGLRPDLKIYGRTHCVATAEDPCSGDLTTFLDIQDGKIFFEGKPASESVLKKNQYDVVERIYQMNIDMIDAGGFVTQNPSIKVSCPGSWCPGDSCTALANSEQTCFDQNTKTLYIRSRLSDKRGHRWMTDNTKTWNQSLGGN